jgi:hypothetical protein
MYKSTSCVQNMAWDLKRRFHLKGGNLLSLAWLLHRRGIRDQGHGRQFGAMYTHLLLASLGAVDDMI